MQTSLLKKPFQTCGTKSKHVFKSWKSRLHQISSRFNCRLWKLICYFLLLPQKFQRPLTELEKEERPHRIRPITGISQRREEQRKERELEQIISIPSIRRYRGDKHLYANSRLYYTWPQLHERQLKAMGVSIILSSVTDRVSTSERGTHRELKLSPAHPLGKNDWCVSSMKDIRIPGVRCTGISCNQGLPANNPHSFPALHSFIMTWFHRVHIKPLNIS